MQKNQVHRLHLRTRVQITYKNIKSHSLDINFNYCKQNSKRTLSSGENIINLIKASQEIHEKLFLNRAVDVCKTSVKPKGVLVLHMKKNFSSLFLIPAVFVKVSEDGIQMRLQELLRGWDVISLKM